MRYVDDIIITTQKEQMEELLRTFSDYHERLKFTVERERNRSIYFLDMTIMRNNDGINTDYYQKNTSSNQCINHFLSHPEHYKIDIIRNLILS